MSTNQKKTRVNKFSSQAADVAQTFTQPPAASADLVNPSEPTVIPTQQAVIPPVTVAPLATYPAAPSFNRARPGRPPSSVETVKVSVVLPVTQIRAIRDLIYANSDLEPNLSRSEVIRRALEHYLSVK